MWIIANKENFESEIKKDKLTNEVFSKKILLNHIYKPKFIEGSLMKVFRLGWANHRNNT